METGPQQETFLIAEGHFYFLNSSKGYLVDKMLEKTIKFTVLLYH